MSSSCCQRSAPLTSQVRLALDAKLRDVSAAAAGAMCPVMICSVADGQVVAAHRGVSMEEQLAIEEEQRKEEEEEEEGSGEGEGTKKKKKKKKKRRRRKKNNKNKKNKKQTEQDSWPEAASMVQALGALRLAAARFASTLQVVECPIVHVKGDTQVFSCYSIGSNYYLAMYSSPEGNVESYDTTQLDMKLESKLEELDVFLRSVHVS